MGEIGFPSRVISPAFGTVFTYAAPAHVQGTAAGQVNARQLRSLYRIDKFTKAAKIYGVIADPGRPIGFAARSQPRVSIAPDRRGLRSAAGEPESAARLLPVRRRSADLRIQRHDSAQAANHALSRLGGSAGPAHRRGEHGLAQSGQMARRQYGCRSRRAAALETGQSAQGDRADRRQRRRGPQRRLRACRCRRKIAITGRNADRVRAFARSVARRTCRTIRPARAISMW